MGGLPHGCANWENCPPCRAYSVAVCALSDSIYPDPAPSLSGLEEGISVVPPNSRTSECVVWRGVVVCYGNSFRWSKMEVRPRVCMYVLSGKPKNACRCLSLSPRKCQSI